jgi:hypothetical protein
MYRGKWFSSPVVSTDLKLLGTFMCWYGTSPDLPPLVKRHKISITRGRSTGLPYQRIKEPINLHCVTEFQVCWNDRRRKPLAAVHQTVQSVSERFVFNFIRWYGRPVDLPRVIEILCLFTSGGRSGDVPYQHIKVPISSVNNICFHIYTPMSMYGFHWSIPHLHIRYYCALRHSTWLRNVGHRVYYVALW